MKPANLGSSVGITKVSKKDQFAAAVRTAFRYDNKIIIEEAIRGREIECSVLGNEKPIASLPGEIVVQHDFYSYDAKYLDDQGARLEIPARLPKKVVKEIQQTAVRAYRALCCEGMARVDFFLQANGKVLVNEINTIPGFTKISMYPKMWEASGPQLFPPDRPPDRTRPGKGAAGEAFKDFEIAPIILLTGFDCENTSGKNSYGA